MHKTESLAGERVIIRNPRLNSVEKFRSENDTEHLNGIFKEI